MRSTLRWRVFARAAVTSVAPSADDSAEFRAALTHGVCPGFDKTDSDGGRRGRAACLGGHGLPPLVDAARAGPHAGRDAAERTGHLRRTGRRLLPRRRLAGSTLPWTRYKGATRGWCGVRATITCGTGWRANRRERSTC